MKSVWATIRHNGDEVCACCSFEGKMCERYNPEKQCRDCKWVTGKVIEQIEEDNE